MSLLVIAHSHPPEGGSLDDLAFAGEGVPLARALSMAERQGFKGPERRLWERGGVWWYPTPDQPRGSGGCWVDQGDRFAACVGTLHWQGLGAEALLSRWLASDDAIAALPWHEVSGSFCLLLGRPDGVWLVSDALGMGRMYHAQTEGVMSTSLLACRAASTSRAIDRYRAQEYVLLGANHGTSTPCVGIEALDPTRALELRSCRRLHLHPAARLVRTPFTGRFEQAVDEVHAALRAEFSGWTKAHDGQVGMALSGGFDSRLILAALDEAGVSPKLYVYGRSRDADVQVAALVAQNAGLPIEAVDKAALEQAAPEFDAARLRANQLFFDGLPIDGVFDRGTDQATRLNQMREGCLNFNGGGGEILRNFFYLPERPYDAEQIQAAFYSAFLDEVFHSPQDGAEFKANVQDDILRSLDREAGSDASRRVPIPRQEVELVYALFRLRWWMGRNNALAARSGSFATPLVSPSLVARAAAVPQAYREFGRLEAGVITALSPRIARGPSAYGFDFSQGPTMRHKLNVLATLYRPLAWRHQSVRVQRMLGRLHEPQVPAAWISALGEPPSDEWLNPRKLLRLDQLNRLLSLQALVRLGG